MSAPIRFSEVVQLTKLGIDASFKFNMKTVTLQSSKYVAIRDPATSTLTIVETATKSVIFRLPKLKIDSAIMNPVAKAVALRSGSNLQIYNLEMKNKMKSCAIPEPVVFWKWLDTKTLAIVSSNSVYHWSMDGQVDPVLVFDRAPFDGDVQIINYRRSEDEKWLMLGGIAKAASGAGLQGVLQVYSCSLGKSQKTMDSHAATFASLQVPGRSKKSSIFCWTKRGPSGMQVNFLELDHQPQSEAYKASANMQLDSNDFPVSMVTDQQFDFLYVTTKAGMLFVYDIGSGKQLYQTKATFLFATVDSSDADGGMVAVDQTGRVSYFQVDKQKLVPYVTNTMNDSAFSVKLAQRYNLAGADQIFIQRFQQLMQSGQHPQAMQLAAESPQGILRTPQTLQSFKSIQNGVLQYLQILLKAGTLNSIESVELARLAKGTPAGVERLVTWFKEGKLEPSEELGDMMKGHNIQLALSIYYRAKASDAVINCFLQIAAIEQDDAKANEAFNKILAYAKTENLRPEYLQLVQTIARRNPDRAKDFALCLINADGGPKVDATVVVDMFMQLPNNIKNANIVLLEYLKKRGDLEEDADLQTKLLEINLLNGHAAVADALLESDDYKFTHYDRLKVAQLCEHAQLYHRALEHYEDLTDIQRVLLNTHMLKPAFLLEYFGRMGKPQALQCLELLLNNHPGNLSLVIEVAKKWSEYLTPAALINLFEKFLDKFDKLGEKGLWNYLGSFVNFTEDAEVVFKYIQTAVTLQQFKELERVCRENKHYDATEVKEFLLTKDLSNPRALIYVCDRFGYVEELTQYLYSHNMQNFIEAYVQRMNSKATPPVIGQLIDLNASEEQIKKMLSSVRAPPDMEDFTRQLVAVCEKRNRLRILRPWLEGRAKEKTTDVDVATGLAKIYVETNNNPRNFLATNAHYDHKEVGNFCESRDPHLSFIAFKAAGGACDQELIDVSNKHGFFKDQAKYLVERRDPDLWTIVLNPESPFRRELIDQVVSTALPEANLPEEVSTTVKSFMAADLPNELIELLERIILHGPSDGEFQTNPYLQNLLILTAMKAAKHRVMDYLNRLENYEGPEIARYAVTDEFQLYEEALFIYKKFKMGEQAIGVLLDHMKNLTGAIEFAEYYDQPEVWSLLAKAQLQAGEVKDAIESLIKANDASTFREVIAAAKANSTFTELIQYLKLARSKTRETEIDNNLIYAYAKTDRLLELEEFISGTHTAKIQTVGDLCFNEQMYKAARVLLKHVNNNAKLAVCYVKLEQYEEAVEAARAANNIETWKQICFSCVDAEKFRLAQMAGMQIIVFMDHLQDLVAHYEKQCYFTELIKLLEEGIQDRANHQGIYTQLGVLYARYQEESLMEHIKLHVTRLNVPTLLGECRKNLHWAETVFLYQNYDQFDNACNTMMQHSPECWTNSGFKEICKRVTNSELRYRAIDFYMAEHPLLLNDLLLDMSGLLDHSRVVHQLSRTGNIALTKKYLLHAQKENLSPINEAVNKLFIEEEDFAGLRESIETYNQFDSILLAQKLENHDLVEFRRLSAVLFKNNKRYKQAISISQKDGLWGDAMTNTAEAKDPKAAEDLLRFFVKEGQRECFSACLFTCYELLAPDVVLELAWRYDLMNFAMPYMIQKFKDVHDQMEWIKMKFNTQDEEKEVEAKKAQVQAQEQQQMGFYSQPVLALPAPPGMGGGYGAPMGGAPSYGVPPPQMQGGPPGQFF